MIYGIIGDNSLLFSTTEVIDTYAYRALRLMGNFSMSATVVLYQSLLGFLTVLLFNGLIRRIDPPSALF
jgi:putative aldouronate transport system permease protein